MQQTGGVCVCVLESGSRGVNFCNSKLAEPSLAKRCTDTLLNVIAATDEITDNRTVRVTPVSL